MIEEDILRSIEASFDISKLVQAFSSVMKVVKSQNDEIMSLREQLYIVDHKFDHLEDYLHTLTDKTYGEQLDIKPYGDIPKSRLPSPKFIALSPRSEVDATAELSPAQVTSTKNSKSIGIAMKPPSLAINPKTIKDDYTAVDFINDEYESESGINTARSMNKPSARDIYLASVKNSPVAVTASSEFEAIVRSVVETSTPEVLTNGKDLFDLSNLVLTMEPDVLQQILKSPSILTHTLKSSSSFHSNTSTKKVVANPPSKVTSMAVEAFQEAPKPALISPTLTVTLMKDAVIDTIEEGDAEDDTPTSNEKLGVFRYDEDEDFIDMPNISTFEYTIVPTEAQLRKRARINRVSRPASESKRLMSIDNLAFLSHGRIHNILHELRVRGHFLQAIHNMMTAKSRKDRETKIPLRKRITELEASIETIFETLEHQKRNIRNAIVSAASNSNSNAPITSFPPPLLSPFIAPSAMSREKSISVPGIKPNSSGIIPTLLSPSAGSMGPPKMSRGHSMVVGDAVAVNLNDRQPIKLDIFGRLPNDIIQTIKLQLDELNINRPPPVLLVNDVENKPVLPLKTPSSPMNIDLQWVKDQIAGMKMKMATKQDLDDAVDAVTHQGATRSRRNSVCLDEMVPKMTRDQTQALIDEVRVAVEKNINESSTMSRKENEELRHTLMSKIGYMQDDMRKLQGNMKIVVEELDIMNTKDDDGDNREGLTLRAQIKKMAGGLVLQNEKQLKDYKELTMSLQRLNSTVDGKPSANSIEKMMELTDTTFKRLLGQNIAGVNTAVLQVVKAVQRKADKDEITKLIAKRVQELETKVKTTLEAGDDAAGSTRCLSCGNTSKPKHMPPIFDTLDFDPDAPFRALGSMQANQHDDDNHVEAEDHNIMHDNINDLAQTSVMSTGSMSSPNRSLRSRGGTSSDKEPLYRRARQVNSNKDAVKVPLRLTTPSLPSMLPASNNQNHLYILDNEDANPHVIFPEVSSRRASTNHSVSSHSSSYSTSLRPSN